LDGPRNRPENDPRRDARGAAWANAENRHLPIFLAGVSKTLFPIALISSWLGDRKWRGIFALVGKPDAPVFSQG
jgi:hypothetical protein